MLAEICFRIFCLPVCYLQLRLTYKELQFCLFFMCIKLGLILREEYRPRGFENRVLRTIFGPKMEEVAGNWGRLRNEELHDLYSLPNIMRAIKSRRLRWAKHVARLVGNRHAYTTSMGKCERQRSL